MKFVITYASLMKQGIGAMTTFCIYLTCMSPCCTVLFKGKVDNKWKKCKEKNRTYNSGSENITKLWCLVYRTIQDIICKHWCDFLRTIPLLLTKDEEVGLHNFAQHEFCACHFPAELPIISYAMPFQTIQR